MDMAQNMLAGARREIFLQERRRMLTEEEVILLSSRESSQNMGKDREYNKQCVVIWLAEECC